MEAQRFMASRWGVGLGITDQLVVAGAPQQKAKRHPRPEYQGDKVKIKKGIVCKTVRSTNEAREAYKYEGATK